MRYFGKSHYSQQCIKKNKTTYAYKLLFGSNTIKPNQKCYTSYNWSDL